MRSPMGSARHSSSLTSAAWPTLLYSSAISRSRSAASGATVEHDVLDALAQLGVDLVVDDQRRRR